MKYTRHFCVVVGIATALMLAALLILVLSNLEKQRRYEAQELGQNFSFRLLGRFNETLGALYLLATTVDRKSGAISRFDEQAADLLRDFPLVRVLELAPGGVISRVYPMRGNESVIGHDLLTDKTRNREVHLAVSRRQLVIAGPFELKQGGIGVVARYPLYQVAPDGRDRFWGLSIAVIDFPSLLRAAGEPEFERLGYRYQICWIPSGESECRLAVGDPNLSVEHAVVSQFGVAQAEWRLLLEPRQGWVKPIKYWVGALIAALIGLLAGWLVHRFARRPRLRNLPSTAV